MPAMNAAVQFPLRNFLPLHNSAGTVAEPAREIPILTECDVAVFGGGPAGACAAAAAARLGAHVLLVERYGFLGGMATAANVNIWHSLYGMDRQTKVIGGLPEEIIRCLQRQGAAYNQASNGETGPWVICSETAKLVFDDVTVGSGVRFAYHTWLAGLIRDGKHVNAAVVEGKSGRQAVVAKVYVDCTGDADLVRRSGAPTQLGNADGGCQPPSLCFRVGGRGLEATPLRTVQAELFKTPMDYNDEHYPTFLWGTHGVWNKRDQMLAGVRVLHVNAAEADDFTRAEIEGRYQMRWVLDQLRRMPGWEDAYLLDVATQIGIRESHRIHADHQLTREEVLHGTRFEDTIAQGTYRIDIHNPDGPGIYFEYLDGTTEYVHGDGTRQTGRWDGQPAGAPLRDTLCYEVPYRCLISRDLENVLAAGRCIGTAHDAAGAIRVMVNAMQFGQAAGTAAALAARNSAGNVRAVDVTTLRQTLVDADVPLRPA
jgi:hypothetical protein